jgi:hypothetical protein
MPQTMNPRTASLLLMAVKETRSYDPVVVLEGLDISPAESDDIKGFLDWCRRNHRQFGYADIQSVYWDYQVYPDGTAIDQAIAAVYEVYKAAFSRKGTSLPELRRYLEGHAKGPMGNHLHVLAKRFLGSHRFW